MVIVIVTLNENNFLQKNGKDARCNNSRFLPCEFLLHNSGHRLWGSKHSIDSRRVRTSTHLITNLPQTTLQPTNERESVCKYMIIIHSCVSSNACNYQLLNM